MTDAAHNRRHNNGPLSDEDARKLWNHVRALESLNETKDDLNLDIKTRKELAKADGFDTNIVGVILKRRKMGYGATSAADNLIQLYEEALEEQKALPLADVTVRLVPPDDPQTPAELDPEDGA